MFSVENFFEKVREGHLTAIKCGRCGNLAIPPKEFCASCGKRGWESVALAGDGTISSYTVIRVAPRGHVGQTPYAVAVVRLAEGVSLLGRITDLPLESLRVGLPVRFRPLVSGGETMVGFGPA